MPPSNTFVPPETLQDDIYDVQDVINHPELYTKEAIAKAERFAIWLKAVHLEEVQIPPGSKDEYAELDWQGHYGKRIEKFSF